MAITTRAGKGSALTFAELDTNFTDLSSQLGGFVNKVFNPVLVFDTHEIYMEITQSADIAFSLAATGNTKNSSITVVITPNGTNAITLASAFLVNGAIDITQVNVLQFYYANASAVPRCNVFNTPYAPGAVPNQTLTTPAISSAATTQPTQMTVSFTAQAAATSQTIQYSTSATMAGATLVPATTSPAVISGLTASTLYYFAIKSSAAGYNDSAYSATVSATTPATVVTGVDPTRFLAYYDSATAGNTATLWQDTSGKGRNATALAGAMTLAVDQKGANQYAATGNWLIPPLTTVAGDYTMYLLVNKTVAATGGNGSFVFDAQTGRLVVADNSAFGGVNSGGVWSMVNNIPVTAAGTAYTLQVWRLASGTGLAKIETNGVVTSTGTYAQSVLGGTMRLGSDYAVAAAQFLGRYRLFAIAAGNDTDAQVAAVRTYCTSIS